MSELIRRFETATKLAAATMEPLTKIVTMDAQAILELLKEQEPLMKKQEPVTIHDPGAYCPECGWILYPEDHPYYCGNCGQAVEWDA